MAQGTLKIHTENLLPIIKKWLYSDKEIFLRELVSNACDALSKLKILREQGETTYEDSEPQIEIFLNKTAKTLTITDTGIGMTSDEVEKYIAQLAFSGAEEFVSKYKSTNENDQVIGHFGLGFYSAYMVSSLVEIQTLSYKPGFVAAYWSCDGSSEYTIDKGTRATRGTEIILHIEDEEFLEESRIEHILNQYCAFLPFPIFLNGTHINHKEPLWLKPAADCTREDYLAFYKELFPMDPEPLFWVHLNVDYPFTLKGILYFPKVDRGFDFQKSNIKLFCNRVFVSDNCKDLIPDYLMVLKGAIDSPNIPLNVSRSYLQMDGTVRSLSTHISKKVADRLAVLYRTEREMFLSHWEDIETIIKLGALQDEKFYDRIKEFLVWKTIEGNWKTLPEYLEAGNSTIFYTQDIHSPFLSLYREKNIDVLIAKGPVDPPLMNFLESKHTPAKFQRIDGALDPSLLDSNAKIDNKEIADFVKKTLQIDNLEVDAKSLSTSSLPAFLLVDEDMRRMRDTMAISGRPLPSFMTDKKTFVVNTSSPLITSLIEKKDPELAKEILLHLYQMAQLSQRELPPDQLPAFLERSNKLLGKLV